MGVPLLLTWLRRRFASCFLPATGDPARCPAVGADCLYIDVNGLVYQAAALATAGDADVEAAILRKLFDLLDDIVMRLVRPRALVYLAVDGVSPLGKLAQQRTRRRRHNNSNNNRGGGSRGIGALWDSNSISVGTPFMARLTEALHLYCASRTERINGERIRAQATRQEEELGPIAFIVDDVTRPGEGENKIADAIRRFRSQPQYDPNTSHVICSSDTDVTVCSLILHEPRIHVLRYEYPAQRAARDGWSSTFFSIYAFREKLRGRLRLELSKSDDSTQSNGHDVAQNPASLELRRRQQQQFERALHDVVFLLLLFGNDFLPSLGCRIEEGFLDDLLQLLATDFISRDRSIVNPVTNTIQYDAARYALDCLSEMRGERSGGLRIENGPEGAADWGFEDDASKERRKAAEAAEEQKQASRCYAYWTMLQWSLHYSAGVVEDWGCYYPYSRAPPLHLLRKYCGMLSYESLAALAEGGASADGTVAKTQHSARPTDALTQLLVLMPARSVPLLPSAVRNAYAEVEPLVQVPVERLDFAAIATWCEGRRRLFTEEERARFGAYALGADTRVLANGPNGETLCGDEVILVAHWDATAFAAERQRIRAQQREEEAQQQKCEKEPTPTPIEVGTKTLMSLGSLTGATSTASFFSGRTARKGSAAAAALLLSTSREPNSLPTSTSTTTTTRGENEKSMGNRDTNTIVSDAEVVVRQGRPEEEHVAVERVSGCGFTLWVASTSVLGDAAVVRGVGHILGDAFVCGGRRSDPLSRHAQTMRVRLRWHAAVRPPLLNENALPDLLPGYKTPSWPTERESVQGTGRKREAMPPPQGSSRGSSASSVSSDGGENVKKGNESHSEGNGDLTKELELTKQAVRRRLEALQAGKLDANKGA